MKSHLTSLLLFSFMLIVNADIAVTTMARKKLQVTVYRDFGVVKDVRTVSLLKGSNRIRFEGVSAEIDESTADFTWTGNSSLDVLGQTYEFDLMSPIKLMEKYIGKELEIIPYNYSNQDTVPETAELISIDGEEPIFRIGTKIAYGQVGRILFPYVPENLYTKPTLILDVESQKRQDIDLTAEYITEGISWNAAYSFDVDRKDETGSFRGWVQFNNKSGLLCKDAVVTFVAGYVHRVDRSATIQNQNFQKLTGDYYFYSINYPVTLQDNKKTQFEWIQEARIRYKQSYCAEFRDSDQKNNGIVFSVAKIENTQKNNLGLPLPGGVVRVSKNDQHQNTWFTGEDLIEDSKTNTTFSIKINPISDIKAKKRIDLEQENKNDFIIEIDNGKKDDCDVTVRDYSYPGRSIVSNNKYVLNDNYIEWNVRVPAGKKSKIHFSLNK